MNTHRIAGKDVDGVRDLDVVGVKNRIGGVGVVANMAEDIGVALNKRLGGRLRDTVALPLTPLRSCDGSGGKRQWCNDSELHG